MKSRPILFQGPMVRALLDGSKTQTRRIVKPKAAQDLDWFGGKSDSDDDRETNEILGQSTEKDGLRVWCADYPEEGSAAIRCPYGQPGDQLWVRETTVKVEDFGYLGPVWVESERGSNVLEFGLAPSEDDCTEVEPEDLKLRPSIFMPKSMSRITLEITAVRVERLQDITRGDAMAEGCPFANMAEGDNPRDWYAALWDQINGPDSWATNPWVWVVEFKRVQS